MNKESMNGRSSTGEVGYSYSEIGSLRFSEATMETNAIIDAIDAEIGKLQEVRALLSVGAAIAAKGKAPAGKTTRRRRRLSPEARKRIADAQKKRWAAVKAAKESTKPAASKKVKKEAPAKKWASKKASPKIAKKAKGKKAAKKAPATKTKKATAQRKSPTAPNTTATVAATEAASS